MNMCSETKQFYRRTQLAFSGKFPKNGRFRLPWSAIDLVNQRRPNPTVAPRDVKLHFGSLLLAVDLYYKMSRFFCKLHRDINVFAIHRCIKRKDTD